MGDAHTPGPWVWDGPSIGSGLTGANGHGVIEDLGYDGLYIDPTCADARLIEAAPDLLDALRGIQFGGPRHRCVECGGQPVTGHINKCRVAAAITKATILPQTEKGS